MPEKEKTPFGKRFSVDEVSLSQEQDVFPGEHELVLQVVHHASELAVDEVECPAEIIGADAHERTNHFFLIFSSAPFLHFCIEPAYYIRVGDVTQVKIRDDVFACDAESGEDERRSPSGSVFALETMP